MTKSDSSDIENDDELNIDEIIETLKEMNEEKYLKKKKKYQKKKKYLKKKKQKKKWV